MKNTTTITVPKKHEGKIKSLFKLNRTYVAMLEDGYIWAGLTSISSTSKKELLSSLKNIKEVEVVEEQPKAEPQPKATAKSTATNKDRGYKYYQPNKKDLKDKTGDCVIRAFCKAEGKEWLEVFDSLCTIGRELQCLPNGKASYTAYLEQSGYTYVGVSNKKGTKRPTVTSFTKANKTGTYILVVANHLVCCKDGAYYDTWDSGSKSLYGYWVKDGAEQEQPVEPAKKTSTRVNKAKIQKGLEQAKKDLHCFGGTLELYFDNLVMSLEDIVKGDYTYIDVAVCDCQELVAYLPKGCGLMEDKSRAIQFYNEIETELVKIQDKMPVED